MSHDHDLVILGAGPAALAAALHARSLGAGVLLIENGIPGGTCANWGCVPSKTLIHGALFRHEAELGGRLGLGTVAGRVDYATLAAHKERVVEHLRQTRFLEPLRNLPGLTMLKGTGRFRDPHTVEVDGQAIRGERFLLATGGYPRIIEFPGIHDVDYLTSRSALYLKQLPASLLIIGGGVIALEMGQMYHRLGTRVTVLEHGPRILPTVEAEPALALQQTLIEAGMEIVLNMSVCSVGQGGGLTRVVVEIDGERIEYGAERLLLAVGTTPASTGIGLEKAGVQTDARCFIRVDERMRTTAPGIWAAGDVTGGMMIASAGAEEGGVAVDDMFRPDRGRTMDYLSIPMAIFTDPELAMVGYGEEAAGKAGFAVRTTILPVSAISKAHIAASPTGLIKMIADRESGRLLGVHLLCHRGADLINEAALAIRLRATVADLAATLHVYPSIGEGLRLCAQALLPALSNPSCGER